MIPPMLETHGTGPVIFLGPSLPQDEASSILVADYRPPIRRGDLDTIALDRDVLILDGEFHQNYPVSPKEILHRLDAGGTVLGAASMGALRAAELADHGMTGIGRIYEAYRNRAIEGDDEVALAYCPFSYESRTVPLVNVRFWLDRLRDEALIGLNESATLLRRARRIYFADRTPARLAALVALVLGPTLRQAIHEAGLGAIPDAKADDARLALATLARPRSHVPVLSTPS